MKKVKMWICLMLAMLMIVPSCGVNAAVSNGESQIQPLYANMGTITATIVISGGTATCKGTCNVTKNTKSVMIVTIQRRTKSGAFSDYDSWSQTFTGTGKKTLTKTKALKSGYYYRTKAEMQIYSSSTSSTIVEAGAQYSGEVWY